MIPKYNYNDVVSFSVVDEWQNKSLVTDEAVDAVHDYLFLNMKPGDKTNGYSWKLQDG